MRYVVKLLQILPKYYNSVKEKLIYIKLLQRYTKIGIILL